MKGKAFVTGYGLGKSGWVKRWQCSQPQAQARTAAKGPKQASGLVAKKKTANKSAKKAAKKGAAKTVTKKAAKKAPRAR